MATARSILDELQSKGSEKTRKTYVRHGMPADRVFGVSVADLKMLAKAIRGQQALACELYATGVMEAMYLAGMVADGAQMTRKQLQSWADAAASMSMISEHTVPWVVVENSDAVALANEWIRSKKEHVASSGWCTYSGLVATRTDEALDLKEIEGLLRLVVAEISGANGRAKYTMNGFVIAVGSYVTPLLWQAKAAAQAVGAVSIDMGDTACEVPLATAYIAKVEGAGRIGKKRKTIRC